MTELKTKSIQARAILDTIKAFELATDEFDNANKAVSDYEKSRGFDYTDEYDDDEYEDFTESDPGFVRLWGISCAAMDAMYDARERFASAIRTYSDNEISQETARLMACDPRQRAKVAELVFMPAYAIL